MKRVIYVLLFFVAFNVSAQNNIDFQKPPKEILELADVERAPSVILDNQKENMILLYRSAYKTIEELSQEEMRLGGLRIDPKTNIGSRTSYSNNIKLRRLKSKSDEAIQVSGLPKNPRLSNFIFLRINLNWPLQILAAKVLPFGFWMLHQHRPRK